MTANDQESKTTPDFTPEITNADRAAHLAAELETYSDGWDIRTNLIDVLTDARHWCHASGESFAELDRLAHQHYTAEAQSKPGGRS